MLLEEGDYFGLGSEGLKDGVRHKEGHDEAVVLHVRQANQHESAPGPDV